MIRFGGGLIMLQRNCQMKGPATIRILTAATAWKILNRVRFVTIPSVLERYSVMVSLFMVLLGGFRRSYQRDIGETRLFDGIHQFDHIVVGTGAVGADQDDGARRIEIQFLEVCQ